MLGVIGNSLHINVVQFLQTLEYDHVINVEYDHVYDYKAIHEQANNCNR